MPNYEYRCLDCKKRFEVFLSFSDYGTALIHCKHCGSTNVQRKIGQGTYFAVHIRPAAEPVQIHPA